MPGHNIPSFTHAHKINEDGSVSFDCSQDASKWPWLALATHHPVLIQSINFWASVESGAARGTFDTSKWSALTQTEWQHHAGTGPITKGVADPVGEDGSPRYGLSFFDAADRLVTRMTGTGVVFRTRDFEAWRAKAKERPIEDLPWCGAYAGADLVGVETQIESFLSLIEDNKAQALITKENGLIPNHPYLDGSGDHVNSTHLAEVARQFACLFTADPQTTCSGGEMQFKRYVELGRVFDVSGGFENADAGALQVQVHQGGRLCAEIRLDVD